MNPSRKLVGLKLSDAWERAGQDAGLWNAWLKVNAVIAEAEVERPSRLSTEELVRVEEEKSPNIKRNAM